MCAKTATAPCPPTLQLFSPVVQCDAINCNDGDRIFQRSSTVYSLPWITEHKKLENKTKKKIEVQGRRRHNEINAEKKTVFWEVFYEFLFFFLSLSTRSQSPIVRCFLVISVERTRAGRHPISFLPGGRMGIGLVSRLASFLYIKIHLNHRVPLFFSLSAVNAFFVFFF